MADVTYRANLSTPSCPIDPLTFGRTVIVKGQDQNYTPNLVSKLDADKDAGIPQVYYMANVLPTEQGYRSVGFTKTLEQCPGTPYFAFPVRSATGVAQLVHTREGFLYELEATGSPQFRYVGTFVGALTYATVSGVTYINIAGVGGYQYDFGTQSLVPVVFAGLDPLQTLGITGIGGYLLAWSADAIAWSSLTDATDFVPSLDTGAGGGSVEGARGPITYCVPNSQGVFVFSRDNCVSATLSNNARYPFNFKEVVGSSGITDLQAVTFDGNQNVAYAYTSGGFQQISQNTAKPIWADLTDSGDCAAVWDEFTVVDNTVGKQRGITGAKLTVVGARYVCVSVQNGTVTVNSVEYPKYRDIWVYDLATLRWGRIVREHFEVFSNADNKLAIIDTDGRIVVAENSNAPEQGFGVERAAGTLVLGKYQYTRQRFLQLQHAIIDNLHSVEITDPLTQVSLGLEYPELFALTYTGAWIPFTRIDDSMYNVRTTAENHSIMVRGNFNLNTVLLIFNNHGGR
jgi:hypothetical protein